MTSDSVTLVTLRPVAPVVGGRGETVEDNWSTTDPAAERKPGRRTRGVFARRGPYRPNHLGVPRCRLIAVGGLDLDVADLDALSGSPVLDRKPYLVEFAPREPVVQPARAAKLMSDYYRGSGPRRRQRVEYW